MRRRPGRRGRVGCVPCGGAAARCGRGGHRGGVEGGDMAVVTDHDPGAVGGEPVPGDHDPGAGGDVEELGADRAGHRDGRGGQLGWHRVAVAAVGDQRLP